MGAIPAAGEFHVDPISAMNAIADTRLSWRTSPAEAARNAAHIKKIVATVSIAPDGVAQSTANRNPAATSIGTEEDRSLLPFDVARRVPACEHQATTAAAALPSSKPSAILDTRRAGSRHCATVRPTTKPVSTRAAHAAMSARPTSVEIAVRLESLPRGRVEP